MNTTTAHSACAHPITKSARALCRKNRTSVKTVTTAYGTFEVRTAHVAEITSDDMIHMTSDQGDFFSAVTRSTWRPYSLIEGVKTDLSHYTVCIAGGEKIVPLDQTYIVAVNPAEVKRASATYSRSLCR